MAATGLVILAWSLLSRAAVGELSVVARIAGADGEPVGSLLAGGDASSSEVAAEPNEEPEEEDEDGEDAATSSRAFEGVCSAHTRGVRPRLGHPLEVTTRTSAPDVDDLRPRGPPHG